MVWKLPPTTGTFDVEVGGEVYSLPLLGEVSLDQIEVLDGLNIDEDTVTISSMRAMFKTIAPDLPVGSLNATQLKALMAAWQKESGVGVGESSASISSSKSTAKR